MKKKGLLVLVGIALIGGAYYLGHLKRIESGLVAGESQSEQSVTLFVGATCSHCKKVEDWLSENESVKEKSGITIKEVYYDKKNAQELKNKAVECQIETSQGIGVPFLYDHGDCLIGDQPIIDYLAEKYNQ